MPCSKKYKSCKGTVDEIAPNHLDRPFKANAPNEKWNTNITEFKLFGGNALLVKSLRHDCSRPIYSLVSEM